MSSNTPHLNAVALAIAQIPNAAWHCHPNTTKPAHEEISMADAATETDIANPEHSEWLVDMLLAEDGPPPPPVLFTTTATFEQAEAVRIIGVRMRQARELNNLTQIEAAKRLGYRNSSKLSKVERATDTNSVPLWLILRAAKVYEVSVDFLFGTDDDLDVVAQRGLQGWLLDAWQEVRARDMAVLARLHTDIAAVASHITTLVAGVRESASALETFRLRNPVFDDMAASGTVAGRMERLQEHASAAEVALRRFHRGLRPATDTRGTE